MKCASIEDSCVRVYTLSLCSCCCLCTTQAPAIISKGIEFSLFGWVVIQNPYSNYCSDHLGLVFQRKWEGFSYLHGSPK